MIHSIFKHTQTDQQAMLGVDGKGWVYYRLRWKSVDYTSKALHCAKSDVY